MSMLEKGSSSSNMSGRGASALAIATRCCWPPDNWCGYLCWNFGDLQHPDHFVYTAWRASPDCSCKPKAILSRTARCGNRAKSWNTIPTPLCSTATSNEGLLKQRPLTQTSPCRGCSNPAMVRNKVVLPQPLGPSRQPILPCSRRKDISEMIVCHRT